MAKKKSKATKRYPGHIEERGPNSFRVTLCVKGVYHRLNVSGTRAEAETKARQEYDALVKRKTAGLPGPMQFSQLLGRFEEDRLPLVSSGTADGYRHGLQAFETFFVDQGRNPGIHQVRPGHVEAFMTWRRSHRPDGSKRTKPVSPRTVAKDRALLHSVFEYAVTLEVAEANPVARTKKPKGDLREPIILKPDEYEALLAACQDNPMLYLYALVLGESGVRCNSEALWLRWDDVGLDTGLLNIESKRKGRRTKSGKSRRVPMTPRLLAAFRDHMARYRFARYGEPPAPTPWVFHHTRTRRHAAAGERLGSFHRAFKSAAKQAGLPEDLRQHDLRHRRVTVWLAEGKPAHIVQKAMGHSDLRTTLHYEHLVDADLLQLVEGSQGVAGERTG